MGCDQQRSATDSVRTRSLSGDSKNYCVQNFDAGSWHETCHGKIHSAASATRAEGTSCSIWENCVRSQGAYFEGNGGVIAVCTMLLVSGVFFNKCLCFSCCMAGYFLDRPHMVLGYHFVVEEIMFSDESLSSFLHGCWHVSAQPCLGL